MYAVRWPIFKIYEDYSILGKVKEQGVTPILLTLPPLNPVRYYETVIRKFSSQVSHWICKTGGIDYWHGKYNRHLIKASEELGVLKIDVRSALKHYKVKINE